MKKEILNHINQQKVVKQKDLVDLPAIDLSKPEKQIIPEIMNNMNTLGFFLLKNVPDFDEGELFKAVRAFYKDIPEVERRKLILRNHIKENLNYFRGILPFVENDPAHKELYDMGEPLNKVSDASLKFPFYEETPFPPQKKF